MEELHDAIEDAQYVNAISTQEGPRPVNHWEVPTEEQLESWKKQVREKEGKDIAFTPEWYLSKAIGFFLFAQFLKTSDDFHRINFIEYIARYRDLPGRQRGSLARKIATLYLMNHDESSLPKKREIKVDDGEVKRPFLKITREEIDKLCTDLSDPSNELCCVGLRGTKVDEVTEKACRKPVTTNGGNGETSKKWLASSISALYPVNLFDELEVVVLESLKKQYWDKFLASEEHERTTNFLWYGDRKVVKEDFYEMRVLGRGGFGLVTACKRGTSGKLYAMKIMSKKRIKIKKAEQLTLNEHSALLAVDSPFVINLKYSFQNKNDIYLILDLMTGGDLSFHLAQKGIFTKDEGTYYAARIMLGLQAMHDNNFVYRDLKPENCLLDEDGRVRITDLGLATKIKPTLQGAAGTRGYWAPEMLQRDSNGKRIPYGHEVDWFSFGCLVAEFISGINPFRSDEALKFGLDKGKESKEKAIDCATLEMEPPLTSDKFDDISIDLCRKLLDKNPKTRLGANGCEDIKNHPWFGGLDWDLVITDHMRPPFKPAKDVNAASQSEIGTFAEDKTFHETTLSEEDHAVYKNWDWANPHAYTSEVIEFLIYERELGRPLLPVSAGGSCCCTVS